MTFEIDQMQRHDWPVMRAIFKQGLATGLAAFTVDPPNWSRWDAGHLPLGRLVARQGDIVLGWSALAPVADT